MSSLARPEVRESLVSRLGRLDSGAPPHWGRMNCHQMVCHLNDSFRVAAQEKAASPMRGLVPGALMKFVALRTPFRWPRNLPTRPEIEQGRGGTPPTSWEHDCENLRLWIESFHTASGLGRHPMFGSMTPDEWHIWGYRHLDHHFRQFGV